MGPWIIILKGLTPIPFKLVTITSGVAKFDLVAFALTSLVSRSLRFFLLAALLWRFGEPVRDFIERRIKEARFPTVKSLDSFDFTAIATLKEAG